MPHADEGAAVELDTAALRVLAHPLRLNVLTLLRQRGPATATRVAEEFGINPGAASYHLRRLAAGGLIEEEPARGRGRERWWRAVHRQSQHDPAAAPADGDTAREYERAVLLATADRLRRAAAEAPLLPRAWEVAGACADFVLELSPDEARRLKDELLAVVHRYRDGAGERAGDAEAARAPVAVQLQAFPVPGTLDLSAPATP